MTIAVRFEGIRVGAFAKDWRAAIRLAGDLLVAQGAVSRAYASAMEQIIEEAGPYCVVAPGLAMPHARPGPWVSSCSIAVLVLASPVRFGVPRNDPVDVLVAFAAPDFSAHVDTLAELACLFTAPASLATIRRARFEAEIAELFGGRPAAGPGASWQ